MKLAILYAGPYRGTFDILKNHLNTFGDNIDIYVSCFEHYLDEWKSSNWPITEYFVTPYIDFDKTNWAKNRNDAAGQSGFWQFWNLKNVIDSIPKNYDFYIKNRNDIIFNDKLNLKSIELLDNVLYSPNESFHRKDWDTNTWLNDEFYIGCERTMRVISKFVTDYYNKNSHHLNASNASNESQLRIHLNQNNINVSKLYNFSYSKNHYGVTSPSGLVKFQLENYKK